MLPNQISGGPPWVQTELGLVVNPNAPKSKLTPNTGAPHGLDLKSGPTLVCSSVTMVELASWLKVFLFADLPVVDQTGLTGAYDFVLHWQPTPVQDPRDDGSDSLPATPNANGQALITALREQLGLELKSQRVSTPVLVIERSERPVN